MKVIHHADYLSFSVILNRHVDRFADAVFCGKRNQKTPDGYYNIERMIKGLLRKGGKVYA